MGYKGWENYVTTNTGGPGAKQSRGARMHAEPVVVLGDGTILTKAGADLAGYKGEFFHSKKEARAWVALCVSARHGKVFELARQVPFLLHAPALSGPPVLIGRYRADFVYRDENGVRHVVDVKGQARREDLYVWKRKHLKAEHGIDIEEW